MAWAVDAENVDGLGAGRGRGRLLVAKHNDQGRVRGRRTMFEDVNVNGLVTKFMWVQLQIPALSFLFCGFKSPPPKSLTYDTRSASRGEAEASHNEFGRQAEMSDLGWVGRQVGDLNSFF